MVAGTLEQGLDLGEAGIEVDLAERRTVVGHQAFEAQFQNSVGHPLDRHAVDAVLELLDIEHGFTSILYLYTAYEYPLGAVNALHCSPGR
ncbi:hypothetical protein D3C85_1366000 [compost metagenome]